MAEDFTDRTCTLSLNLRSHGGDGSIAYDVNGRLEQRLLLFGRVDDPYRTPAGDIDDLEPDSVFHDQSVEVVISSPPDRDVDDRDLERWKAYLAEHDVEDTCGSVFIRAGVKPELFEDEGETLEVPPVTVGLGVGAEAFEAIRHQAATAYREGRVIRMDLTLVGKQLPKSGSDFVFLKEFDVSKNREYPIAKFEMFVSRHVDSYRNRVLPVEDAYNGTSLSIRITETRFKVSAGSGRFNSISCEGCVIDGEKTPYDAASVTIEFSEYPINRRADLPHRDHFGRFQYVTRENDLMQSAYFMFDLRYVPGDADSILFPLLIQEAETWIILEIGLMNKRQELIAAKDELLGNVGYYEFEIRKTLVDYAASLRAITEVRDRLYKDPSGRHFEHAGVKKTEFQDIRRYALSGVPMSHGLLSRLSFDQLDELEQALRFRR